MKAALCPHGDEDAGAVCGARPKSSAKARTNLKVKPLQTAVQTKTGQNTPRLREVCGRRPS
jgi:hypothetical protein